MAKELKPYKMVVWEYTETGAARIATVEATHPLEFEPDYTSYRTAKQADGKNRYKVELYGIAYKAIADPDAFMAQFKA